jgi:hypothetical protein
MIRLSMADNDDEKTTHLSVEMESPLILCAMSVEGGRSNHEASQVRKSTGLANIGLYHRIANWSAMVSITECIFATVAGASDLFNRDGDKR